MAAPGGTNLPALCTGQGGGHGSNVLVSNVLVRFFDPVVGEQPRQLLGGAGMHVSQQPGEARVPDGGVCRPSAGRGSGQ